MQFVFPSAWNAQPINKIMKTKIIIGMSALLLAASSNLFAQDLARNPGAAPVLLAYDQPQAAAVADADNAGGGAGKDAKDQEAELAQKLQNPVASLISVPIQNNWDFGLGPAHAMKYTANIQPVVPISISHDWNLIVRTIVPVIYQDALDNTPGAPASVGQSHSGLGDTTQSFFFSPKAPVGGWILGAGPVGYYPTATSDYLGGGKWGAGPTIVALRQEHGFTYGILANQIWSFAGQDNRQNINSTFLQPFVSFTTKTFTTFSVNTESTYNWQANQATVPMNFGVQQLVKIGGRPVAFQFGYRYYINRPDGGPDWGLRFTITFLFPK
jgi:hypothetical protein